MGINNYDEKALYKFLGPPLIESFMGIFGFDELKAYEAVDIYREYFSEIGIFENKMYDGIELLLKSLVTDERKIILATSKPEVYAVRILEHFNISYCFWGHSWK